MGAETLVVTPTNRLARLADVPGEYAGYLPGIDTPVEKKTLMAVRARPPQIVVPVGAYTFRVEAQVFRVRAEARTLDGTALTAEAYLGPDTVVAAYLPGITAYQAARVWELASALRSEGYRVRVPLAARARVPGDPENPAATILSAKLATGYDVEAGVVVEASSMGRAEAYTVVTPPGWRLIAGGFLLEPVG